MGDFGARMGRGGHTNKKPAKRKRAPSPTLQRRTRNMKPTTAKDNCFSDLGMGRISGCVSHYKCVSPETFDEMKRHKRREETGPESETFNTRSIGLGCYLRMGHQQSHEHVVALITRVTEFANLDALIIALPHLKSKWETIIACADVPKKDFLTNPAQKFLAVFWSARSAQFHGKKFQDGGTSCFECLALGVCF